MIQVSIDLNKFGMGVHIETLCTIRIWNTGIGTVDLGEYGYEIRDKDDSIMVKGDIKNHPRQNTHITKLLQKVLNDAFPIKG